MRYFVLSLLLLVSANALSDSSPIPLEAFARLADVDHPALSPDGRYLALTVRVDLGETSGRTVMIMDLETGEREFTLNTDNETFVFLGLQWANDHKLLVNAFYPSRRYFPAHFRLRPSEQNETVVMTVDARSGHIQPLLSDRFLGRIEPTPMIKDNIIDFLPDDDDHILLNMTGNEGWPLVYRVNLNNQRTRRVQSPEVRVVQWGSDQQGRVRLAFAVRDNNVEIRVRSAEKNDWHSLWEFEAFSPDSVDVLGFGKDPNILYHTAYTDGYKALYRLDLRDRENGSELVFADPGRDVEGRLLYSQKNGEVVGISYARDDGFVFWDEGYENFQRAIDRALPDTFNRIVSMSRDERRYLVMASNDRESGTFFLGDREAGTLDAVARVHQDLPPDRMRPTQRLTYEARDGLEIEAFLTLPEHEADTRLPLVLMPHGGPIARDHGGFNYWTQLMASRGYAVLQMNFRGSSGHGLDFMRAGLGDWGGAMQDDVQDGALYLIQEGIADPDRICLVGGSYGGYAALMGVVKTPDFYRCAFSFGGVSDLPKLLRDRGNFRWQLGTDRSKLREVSPAYRADAIQVPVMLVHGDRDLVADVGHSQSMHSALESAGKEVEYIELENGNHFLTRGDHRERTLRALERFLAQNLSEK